MAGETMFTDGSMCQPHHITSVSYPDVDLLRQAQQEEVALIPVHDVKSRYAPRPLITGDAMTVHAWRMCSVRKASIPHELTAEQLQGSDHPSDISRLVEDMDNAEECTGETMLGAVTYSTVADVRDEDRDIQVRILRKTTFYLRGTKRHREKTYNLTLADLAEFEHETSDSSGLWFKNLTDLIFRRSDLAVLCVQARINMYGLTDVDLAWLPRRHPNYRQVLDPMVVNGEKSSNEEGNDCRICWESFSSEQEVVQVPCEGPVKHRFHLSCLVMVCETEGPENSRCPLCRRKLIVNEADMDFLKYGCIGKDYILDARYNAFDNFEKSCADLDRTRASDVDEDITICEKLFKAIFAILVKIAKMEQSLSTPLHLQFVNCDDFGFLEQAVHSTIKVMDGMTMQERTLFNSIKAEFLNVVTAAFKAGGLVHTLDQDELDHWANHQRDAARLTMRPGFNFWASNLVNKTCEFVRLRRCDCTSDRLNDDFGRRFHLHGLRTYYNPDPEFWDLEAVDDELLS